MKKVLGFLKNHWGIVLFAVIGLGFLRIYMEMVGDWSTWESLFAISGGYFLAASFGLAMLAVERNKR